MEEPVAPEDPDALQKQTALEALGENPTTWAKTSLNDVVAEGTEVDVGTRDMLQLQFAQLPKQTSCESFCWYISLAPTTLTIRC